MILYFSGTGNSLHAARVLGKETEDTVIHVADLIHLCGACTSIQNKVLGFVFPVYFGDIPKPFQEFIECTRFSPSAYIYAIATCGSSGGNALYHVNQILQRKNCRLSYGRIVPMIANSTATWKKKVTYEYTKLDAADALLTRIGADIKTGVVDTKALKNPLLARLMQSHILRRIGEKRFSISVDSDACTRCGLCVTLCPTHNLLLSHNEIHVGKRCSYCMACAHHCPSGGILVHGRAIKRENAYHYPGITANDLKRR